MKKFLLIVLILFCLNPVFAQESSEQNDSEPHWTFTSAVSIQLSPIFEAKQNAEGNKNQFAPITGINVPVPYAQFNAQYIVPLDFGDNLVFQGANLLFVAGPTITPVSLDTQLGVIFTPTPILNFGLAVTAGTGWAIGESHGIGIYKPLTNEYVQNTPFATWKYDFIFQTQFQFDFGFLIPSKWTHIILSATEQIYYEAHSGAGKAEPWEWMGSPDYVNGVLQAGNVLLGYTIPDTSLRLIGIGLTWQSHLSGSDYGIYEANYNGSFTTLALALQSVISLSKKDLLSFGLSLSSRRAFLEAPGTSPACITKTASGREWCFSGLSVQWIHTF